MIHKYLFKKVAQTVITKIVQGDTRGLWSYVKKAALGVAIGAVIVVVLFIVGFIFLIQFLISLFTNTVNVESLHETKSAVTDIVNSTEKITPENIRNTIIQTKETVAPAVSVVKEGEAVFNRIETYIQKFENLLP